MSLATPAYAHLNAIRGTEVSRVRKRGDHGAAFGNLILVAFLLTQCLDGVFTYVGVVSYGLAIEANPIMASLMETVGHGAGLWGAKGIAAGLGICLHLQQVHGVVAVLAVFYSIAAVLPWMAILFF